MEDNKHEDIDMLYILRSIKSGIANVFKSIVWLIEFSVQKSIPLLIFIIISVLLSIGVFKLKKPYYKNEMVIEHSRFNNHFCWELLNSLNTYINTSENNKTLGIILNVNDRTARDIKKITYAPLNMNLGKRYADSLTTLTPFKVEVEVYNNAILDSLENGILAYLEKNEFATKTKEVERQTLDEIDQKLDGELKNLESLKEVVTKGVVPQSTGNGIILGEPINPVSVYEISMKLYEQKLKIQKLKKMNDSFYVVVGFSDSKKVSFDSAIYILLGVVVGYLVGILYLLRRRSKKMNPERTAI